MTIHHQATIELWGALVGSLKRYSAPIEFDGDAMADDARMGLRKPLTPSTNDGVRHPGNVGNLWFDTSDHGRIRSVAHAVVIVRANLIQVEYADYPHPMEPIERRNFDAGYGTTADIVTHVLDWAYMFERPGFDASPREHRVSDAWEYIIDQAEDFDTREDFINSLTNA